MLSLLPYTPPKNLCFIEVESIGRIVIEPDQDQPLMSGAAHRGRFGYLGELDAGRAQTSRKRLEDRHKVDRNTNWQAYRLLLTGGIHKSHF